MTGIEPKDLTLTGAVEMGGAWPAGAGEDEMAAEGSSKDPNTTCDTVETLSPRRSRASHDCGCSPGRDAGAAAPGRTPTAPFAPMRPLGFLWWPIAETGDWATGDCGRGEEELLAAAFCGGPRAQAD